MKIAIQGQLGSYHHQAAQAFFGKNIEIESKRNFRSVFESLAHPEVDYALIASENSLYGSINEVYDLLLEFEYSIIGEQYVRVEHALIGLPGSRLDDIREVYSQDIALAQCNEYLRTNLPRVDRHAHHDTAGAVADVLAWAQPNKAAIASELAAKQYGGQILAKNIETNHQNYTRFIALSRSLESSKRDTKTSIILRTAGANGNDDQKAGALFRALESFASRNINLSKIESRPVIGKAWHYLFYVDFDRGLHEEDAQSCLDELKVNGNVVRILGSYQGKSL